MFSRYDKINMTSTDKYHFTWYGTLHGLKKLLTFLFYNYLLSNLLSLSQLNSSVFGAEFLLSY